MGQSSFMRRQPLLRGRRALPPGDRGRRRAALPAFLRVSAGGLRCVSDRENRIEIGTTKLKSGEQLVIKMIEPPLGEYANKVVCWDNVRNEMLGGEMAPWLFAPYFIGEMDGEVAGSMNYDTPTDTRDVGVVEFVETAEKHRRKGVASALLGALIERFRADGGMALYLCTGNPIAGSLYERHGFQYLIGDGMRYIAPGVEDFDGRYLSFCGEARIRDATWGDLPRAAVLYNHPEPSWFLKDYLTQTFRQTRYESHFMRLMKEIEIQGGAFLVLENPGKCVVGAAALKRFGTFFEQHVAELSFRVCPSYLKQAPELLNAVAERAKDLSVKILQIHIADCDDEAKELVKTAGFSEETRLRDRLRDGEGWMDLLVYTLHLLCPARPVQPPGNYYGSRNPWMEERIASSQD